MLQMELLLLPNRRLLKGDLEMTCPARLLCGDSGAEHSKPYPYGI